MGRWVFVFLIYRKRRSLLGYKGGCEGASYGIEFSVVVLVRKAKRSSLTVLSSIKHHTLNQRTLHWFSIPVLSISSSYRMRAL